jgi:hypothetical protein
MKKILIIAYRSAIPSFVLFLTVMLFQSPLQAQQQTKKGRWFIKHNAVGFQYKTDEQRVINSAGVLLSLQRQRELGFFTSFSGPDYGDLNADHTTFEEPGKPDAKYRNFNIVLEPVAGVFVQDNFLLGASVRIRAGYSKFNVTSTQQRFRNVSLGLGPFVRYYFGGTDKARFFGGLESRYTFSRDVSVSNSTSGADKFRSDSRNNDTEIILSPHTGYAWFAGKRWSFELQVGYRYRSNTSEEIYTLNKNGTTQPGYPTRREIHSKSSGVILSAGIGLSI